MLQRIPEILFNVLMGTILLTHVVVPHHHHDDTICVAESHCDPSGDSHDHTGHQHDGTEMHHCALKDPAVLNSGRIIPAVKLLTIFSKSPGPEQFDAVLFGEFSFSDVCQNRKPPEQPYVASWRHSRLLHGTSGLRAPPVV